jgi:hypothetical protein
LQQPSTSAVINGVKVEAFPSHLASLRGYDRVRAIISDETDYYKPVEQKELQATIEGFIGKTNSDPTIALISTPFAPGGIMQQIGFCQPQTNQTTATTFLLALTFSLYSLADGLPLSRIPQHSQNKS